MKKLWDTLHFRLRIKLIKIIFFYSFSMINSYLFSQIIASKHNLSVFGTGVIKATSEQEICKFCHIPHKASSNVPLWDHTISSVSYSQYTSTTFSSSYQYQYPDNTSKLCLSCHDGTIAIGATINGQINVVGGSLLDPDQSLSISASSNIGGSTGVALMDDHPISITFNSEKNNYYTTIGQTDPVNCRSCHDPHGEDKDPIVKKFLSQSNSNSTLCLKCHNPAYWSSNPSIHQSSNKTLPSGLSHTGYTTVASNGCENCHKPHNASNPGQLIKAYEQNTCDPCHKGISNSGITSKNVSNESGGPFAKIYRHPTYSTDGKHISVNATPVSNSPDENSINLSTPNRHAECYDCHNPHAAKSGLHTSKSNLISNVLSGVWGLEPNAVTKWTQPTTFIRIDPATKEYQICMKCHSYYGLGSTSTGVTTIIGPSGQNITDQAFEYNVSNYAVHPVKVGLNDQTGSYSPRSLTANQMTTSWNNVGTQTMYCSDCHGNDTPVSTTEADGPHGSNRRFMLKGSSTTPSAQYWPTNANGVLWSLYDIKNNRNNWQTDLFCVNCHPIYSGGSFKNNVHSRGQHQGSSVKCITCHVVVPHGSKRSRLIGYASEPAPYNYSGAGTYDKLVIVGFRKASNPNGYSKNYCSMTGLCHHTQTNTYDP